MPVGYVKSFYNDQVRNDYLEFNPSQDALCEALDGLLVHVNTTIAETSINLHRNSSLVNFASHIKKMFKKESGDFSLCVKYPPHSQGLYIYGSVGSGKTMLMDVFFKHVHTIKKRRSHFHSFMLDVHARIHEKKMAVFLFLLLFVSYLYVS